MGEKEKLRCRSCNWKFTRAQKPALCPYCGRQSVEIDTTLAADDLLKELD